MIDAAPADDTAPRRPWLALAEVAAVCGLPTQFVLSILVAAAGLAPGAGPDQIALPFLATVALLDTALVLLLLHLFLARSRESAARVFLGSRGPWRESLLGLALVPVALVLVASVVLTLRMWFPFLRTVEGSPFDAFLSTPFDAAVLLVVAVLSGGVREELQRAFILHRFDRHLGGMRVGLVVFSVFFAVFHLDQGVDVAIGIGLLGLAWGLAYARRGSVLLSMANHAGFNAVQVAQAVFVRSMGVG